MKKTKLFLAISFAILVFSFVSFATSPFLKASFDVSCVSALKKGDTVTCTFKCEDITATGLSSFEIFIKYSDGLAFKNDCAVSALPDGWTLWEPYDQNGVLKIGVVDESVENACFDDVEVTLSFEVETDKASEEYVKVSECYFYDFDLNERVDVDKDFKDVSFDVNKAEFQVKNLGASLRLNNTPALRFGAEIDEIKGEAGMIVIEKDKLSGELTRESEGARDFKFSSPLKDNVYTTEAVEISSLDTEYVFRPYVIYTPENETEPVCVLFETLSRSARQVATKALEVETDGEKKQLLNSLVNPT